MMCRTVQPVILVPGTKSSSLWLSRGACDCSVAMSQPDRRASSSKQRPILGKAVAAIASMLQVRLKHNSFTNSRPSERPDGDAGALARW
jgi:hypothetical protein